MVEFRCLNSRPVHRQPYLLLMMPALGQFPHRIEPVWRDGLSRPAYAEYGGSKRVQGLMKRGALLRPLLKKRDEERRAQTAVNPHAILV